jgi:hypothetical protein
MKITPWGAAGEVTGSASLVEKSRAILAGVIAERHGLQAILPAAYQTIEM